MTIGLADFGTTYTMVVELVEIIKVAQNNLSS
jgi:hypothetical protein